MSYMYRYPKPRLNLCLKNNPFLVMAFITKSCPVHGMKAYRRAEAELNILLNSAPDKRSVFTFTPSWFTLG